MICLKINWIPILVYMASKGLKRAGFRFAFLWEKPVLIPGLTRLAESLGLTKCIFPRNPESDNCVQFFILTPTHKQPELANTSIVVCTEL